MDGPQTLRQRIARFAVRVVDLVASDRNADYGDPEDDFAAICGVWSLIRRGDTRIETPSDHALYMVVVKLVREGYRPKDDNRLDAAAYLAIRDDLEERR